MSSLASIFAVQRGATVLIMSTSPRFDPVSPVPLYEQAAVKFLASQGRKCTVTRSFEIVMSELEIQYNCTP